MRIKVAGGTLLALLATVEVRAQVPAGDDFLVSASTTNFGFVPRVAMDPRGGFVVVWRDSALKVSARWFVSRGFAVGSERQMSTADSFNGPAVAADRQISMVVWSRVPFVDGQMFMRFSQPIGAEFRVASGDYTFANTPAAAVVPGGFVVAWAHTPGAQSAVLGRRYDRAGRSLGPAFIVSAYTTDTASAPAIAASERGDFVAVWQLDRDAGTADILGQLMNASGTPRGAQFRVNEVTTGQRFSPRVVADDAGNFVVVWLDRGGAETVKARLFDATGSAQGAEFVVRTFSFPAYNYRIGVAGDSARNFAVVWEAPGAPPHSDLFGRRFTSTGLPRGAEFRVNSYTTLSQYTPSMADDGHGNFVVVWEDNRIFQDARSSMFGRRYGGLEPAGLAVSDAGNAVLEPGDYFVLATLWTNVSGATQTFQGRASSVVAPPGLTFSLSLDATYPAISDGSTGSCVGPCFGGSLTGQRPPGHVDVRFLETIVPDAQGQVERWKLHVGDSFSDVPRSSPFYFAVENLLHHGITAGCGASTYCPAVGATREQMAVFVLTAKEGAGFTPPGCTTPVFSDVPASSPFCSWIEELVRRGVAGGCGGGNFCPSAPVSREQMPVFVLRTLDPALNPPACTTPVFNDVPASSLFCRWIEELARRGIVTGCGGGNYCPTAAVTREQMAAFLGGTFGLTMYGP